MPTTTFPVTKDARIAQSGSLNLGAGKSDYLPVGLSSGYLYRSLLGFSYSFAGMVSISSAVLHMKTSSQHYLGFGSDPDVNVYRITEAWSEGTADGLSGSNAVHWGNQPAIDATESVGASAVPTTENTWWTCDITNLMQEALADGVFHGLRLRSSDEGNSNDRTEFYAREYGSNDAYIEVTYSTNTAPEPPTLGQPVANLNAVSKVPTFTFTHNDPQGDPCVRYRIEVMTGAGTGTLMWASGDQTSGISGDNITKAYAGSALANGTAYYWRAVTYDGSLWGAWTGWRKFTTVYTPSTSLTEPAASGIVAKVSYSAGSNWLTPRLTVSWTFNCADLSSQSHYRVQVGTTPGTGNLYDSGMVASNTKSIIVPLNLTEGQLVYVRVMGRCIHGEDSPWSVERNVRTRWGMARFSQDLGAGFAAITNWSISSLLSTRPDPVNSAVVVEYGSSAAEFTAASAYFASLASVARTRYFQYRVWLMAWGSATPAPPSLDKLVLSVNANAISPDNWTLPATGSIDESTRVYGTQSLKMNGNGSATNRAWQAVKVETNTHYMVQCRIRAQGAAAAVLGIALTPTGPAAVESLPVSDLDWTRVVVEFDSGDLDEVYVQCAAPGPAGSYAWFDAVKMEASTVATPWTPGFLGEGVVLDAGGVGIDAANGGILRLRGSTGGPTDVVELATKGLRLGGPGGAEVYGSSPAGGLIATPGSWTNMRGVVVVPFSFSGTLLASGVTDMPLIEAAGGISQMRNPFNAQVVAVSIALGTNRSAGTLSAQVFNGSSSLLVGPAALIDGTVLNLAQAQVAPSGLVDIGITNFFRLRLTTVGFAPLANVVKGLVYLAFTNA